MKTRSLYSLLIILLVVGCGQDNTDQTTRRGYRYVHHVDEAGQKAVPGEYAYFNIVMRHGDSILNTSYGMADIPRIRIPNAEEFSTETPIIVDALEIMGKGDSLTLYYPLDSLENVPPAFAHIDVVEYDLALVDIKTGEEYQAEMDSILALRQVEMQATQARKPEVAAFASETLSDYNQGNLGVETTPSGLKYIIHEEGTGDMPSPGDMVSVHYFGTFMDGNSFDTSFEGGEPFTFPLGQGRAIPGWDEGIAYLMEGAKASLIVPPALGYGETGYMDIPGNTTLYFYVELKEVN